MDVEDQMQRLLMGPRGWFLAGGVASPSAPPESPAAAGGAVPADTEGSDTEQESSGVEAEAGDYVLSFSKKHRFCCVHKANGCYRRPGIELQNYCRVTSLEGVAFDALCKSCWPRAGAASASDDAPAVGAGESSGSAEGESSSSSEGRGARVGV